MPTSFSARNILTAMMLALAVLGAGCANKNKNLQGGAGGVGVATPGSAQDFQVNVGDRVFFETDSSALTPQAQATVTRQVQWLQQYGRYTFTIEGHADERGTREYNLALGARRANTVRDFMIANGIPAQRMRTTSYGKERPVAVCDNISCWSQNRRAVIVLDAR